MSDQKNSIKTVCIEVVNDEGANLPFYATPGASGMDLRAFIPEPINLKPGSTELIPTGLKIAIPEGYEVQIRPRSGMAYKYNVIPLNTPGTIDSDYRGEVKIILCNLGKEPFIIEPQMRVAQMVLAPYSRIEWQSCKELSHTDRGEHGFGGTGIH